MPAVRANANIILTGGEKITLASKKSKASGSTDDHQSVDIVPVSDHITGQIIEYRRVFKRGEWGHAPHPVFSIVAAADFGDWNDISLEAFKSTLILDKVARDWPTDELCSLFLGFDERINSWLVIRNLQWTFKAALMIQARTQPQLLKVEVREKPLQDLGCFINRAV